MSAAFVGSLCHYDEIGDADAGVDRRTGPVVRAGRRSPATRREPRGGSEVACG
jgi:hypothetical protein